MQEQPNQEQGKRESEEEHWIPRPPRITSSADFIVVIFACTVATILVGLTFGTIIAAIFSDFDIKPYFAILSSIMTSMISALVGYLAGKGQGRQDAEKDQ